MATEIEADEFQATCLTLLDQLEDDGTEVVVLRGGQPVAKLVPVASPSEVEHPITSVESRPSEIFPPAESWSAAGTTLSPDGSAWAVDG